MSTQFAGEREIPVRFVKVKFSDFRGMILQVEIPPATMRRISRITIARGWNVGRFLRDAFADGLRGAFAVHESASDYGEDIPKAGSSRMRAPASENLSSGTAVGTVQPETELEWLEMHGIAQASAAMERDE